MERDWVNLTWAEKTWGERAQTVVCNIVATAVCLAGAFGVMMVIGMTIDVAAERSIENDRCLKNATNGYEIKQCR